MDNFSWPLVVLTQGILLSPLEQSLDLDELSFRMKEVQSRQELMGTLRAVSNHFHQTSLLYLDCPALISGS